MSDNLRDRLVKEEEFRKFPYQDSRGIWTIGVGHNIEVDFDMKNKLGVLLKNGLTTEEVYRLLDKDIEKAVYNLSLKLPWTNDLDEVRREVLVDMVFNMGINKVIRFNNTLNLIKNGKYHEASENLKLSLWYSQVGVRAKNLCRVLDTGVL